MGEVRPTGVAVLGYRLGAFVFTIIGMWAILAFVGALTSAIPLFVIPVAVIAAGSVSLVMGFRRRLGLGAAGRRTQAPPSV